MAEERIPLEKLGIPEEYHRHLAPETPGSVRLAVARGAIPVPIEVQLGICAALAADEDPAIQAAVVKTIRDMPAPTLARNLNERTHPKILEILASLRAEDPVVAGALIPIRACNDRTAFLIASKIGADLCERVAYNHERLLMTPKVWEALYDNPDCPDHVLEKATSFLRLHKMLPKVDRPRPGGSAASEPARVQAMDIDAEIEAALRGETSPALQARSDDLAMFDLNAVDDKENPLKDFKFDFKDETAEFGWEMLDDNAELNQEDRITLEKKILALSVGQRVKLAYVGNKAVRGILVRDINKLVSVAVIRSGRCSDGEVANFAANRNLADDVMREIAMNPEFTRKYPVKVALVNNPKTPVSAAVNIVNQLNRRDLQDLTHNHNISSVIGQMAKRLFNQKYRSN